MVRETLHPQPPRGVARSCHHPHCEGGGELATPEGIHFVQLKKDPKEEGLVQGPSPVNKMCALL